MKTKISAFLVLVLCFCTLSAMAYQSLKTTSQSNYVPETFNSLATAPVGAVEMTNGVFQSLMLKKSCSYRVFSPINPTWKIPFFSKDVMASEGMRLVVYVMNLNGAARPSAASDLEIIQSLIKDSFIVVTIDYAGAQLTTPLEMHKDITHLFCMFGGHWNSLQNDFTQNRKTLLEFPGPNAGVYFDTFNYAYNGVNLKVPINRGEIFVIPSGYTVKTRNVIRKQIHLTATDSLSYGVDKMDFFGDVVYPMPSSKNDKVPLIIEGSSNGAGEFVVNTNTPVIYSFVFNGYAMATVNYVSFMNYFTDITALRYFEANKEQFSLTGRVGLVGISKSCARSYNEANYTPQKQLQIDTLSYGKAPNHVNVCMPVVGDVASTYWNNLSINSPAVVLSFNELNTVAPNGPQLLAASEAYKKAGYGDKCLYFSSPLAGHEYDMYHLNEIMKHFDKFCKDSVGVSIWSGKISTGFSGGDGSQAQPFLIKSGDELAYLAQQTNLSKTNTAGKFYKITSDIDLNYYPWTAIGTLAQPFGGMLDGNNHKIAGIQIFDYAADNQGLFGSIQGSSATAPVVVKNLTLSSGFIYGRTSIGGIVGRANNIKITNCKNYATVLGISNYTGSMCGLLSGVAVIDSCSNFGKISGAGSGYVGGIVGLSSVSSATTDNSYIRYCSNTGSLVGATWIGGLVGSNSGNLTVNECFNTGTIAASNNGVGGIVGYGYGLLTIQNCYNTGIVKQTANYTTAPIFAGGILGFPGTNVAGKYFKTIANCYNTGSVLTYNNLGVKEGITGSLSGGAAAGGSGVVSNCYYQDTLTVTNLSGGVAKTSLLMQSAGFVDLLNNGQTPAVWVQGGSLNKGYPVLAHYLPSNLLTVIVNYSKEDSHVTLYSNKSGIVLDIPDNTGATVSVYTVTGALIYQQFSTATRWNIPAKKGAYIISVRDQTHNFTGKTIVN